MLTANLACDLFCSWWRRSRGCSGKIGWIERSGAEECEFIATERFAFVRSWFYPNLSLRVFCCVYRLKKIKASYQVFLPEAFSGVRLFRLALT